MRSPECPHPLNLIENSYQYPLGWHRLTPGRGQRILTPLRSSHRMEREGFHKINNKVSHKCITAIFHINAPPHCQSLERLCFGDWSVTERTRSQASRTPSSNVVMTVWSRACRVTCLRPGFSTCARGWSWSPRPKVALWNLSHRTQNSAAKWASKSLRILPTAGGVPCT